MRSRIILLVFLAIVFALAYAVQGDDWMSGYRATDVPQYNQWVNKTSTVVHARSNYRNPYFRPNSNYEPQVIGEPEWVDNEFKGQMGKPPRGLLDILVKGTYTIKKPEPPQPYVGVR